MTKNKKYKKCLTHVKTNEKTQNDKNMTKTNTNTCQKNMTKITTNDKHMSKTNDQK